MGNTKHFIMYQAHYKDPKGNEFKKEFKNRLVAFLFWLGKQLIGLAIGKIKEK